VRRAELAAASHEAFESREEQTASHQARIDALRGEAYWQTEAAAATAQARQEFAVQSENYARAEAAAVNDMRTRFRQMEWNMAEERERRDAEQRQAAQQQFADYVASLRGPVAAEALRIEGPCCRETPSVAPPVPSPFLPPTPLAPIIENPAPQASVVLDGALAEARDEAERVRSEYQALLWERSSEGNTGGPGAPATGELVLRGTLPMTPTVGVHASGRKNGNPPRPQAR
jgi:phage-related minor tail protein